MSDFIQSSTEGQPDFQRAACRSMHNNVQADISESRWFAVWTRSRQEKLAAGMLDALGVEHFLPLKSERRQWSDRKQTVSVPLFSGYLFVWMNPTKDSRLQVLKTPGIAGFVGNSTGPSPIPDQQIEDIRIVLAQRSECSVLPLLATGDHVRVVRGPLAGVQGRLLQSNSTSRLLITIEMIHKTIAVSVSPRDVELLDPPPCVARDDRGNERFHAAYPMGEGNRLTALA